MLLVDGHCDTIKTALDKNVNLEDGSLSFNLKEAYNNRPLLQMMAAFVNPIYQNSFQRACDIISYFEKQKERYQDTLMQITSNSELEQFLEHPDKIGCMLTIENGRAIEDNLENIDYFYEKGVRVMSINWNEDNLLGCGAQTTLDNGLTNLGKEYVKKLNQKNIIIDISHSSEKTFWNAMKITEKPLVATHSCVYTLCHHPRNLKDEQIKEIANMGGIIGICYCAPFLSETGVAETKDIAKHIAYIASLVGIDYVGLGSDFDGLDDDEIPTNLKGIKDTTNLVQELKKYGFHENEIEKIMGENWIRVLKEQLK